MTSKQDITMSKNLDFLLKRDLSKYTNDQLAKILYSSDIDLERNEQILNNILTTDKEKIIKVLTNKCQNTCPTFVKYIEELLNTPEKATELLFIHNLSTDVLTNDLYSVAKLFSYVNDKPQDYINGKYSEKVLEVLKKERKYGTDEMLLETLSSAEKDALNEIKASIKRNFDDKITDILDAVTATDLETVKLLLDKRFDAFNTELHSLTMFTPEKKNLLANLIRNGKRINKNGLPDKLTGQQKVDLINIVKCCQEIEASCGVKFDYEKYMTPTQGKAFVFNIEALQKDLFEQILIRNGMSADEIAKLKPEDLAWDYTRISLLAKSIYMDEGELATLVNEASKGNFKQFITDPTNPHGKANLETKTRFEELGLDYAKWQTGPEAQTFKIGGQEYTVKLWNRVPQESLFDGSYTTCCTALDGGNGGSMANYMLNTAINVVEVKDKNGKVVAMSRCYIADVGGKQTFVIENIEANNQLIARMTDNGTTANLVEGLHNYLKDFATEVGGEDMPVYMSTSFAKVSYPFKANFKAVQKPVKLTGEISKNQIYLNTYCGYVDANNLTKPAEFYIVRE